MRTLACLFLSLFALTCWAQQYRWVDEKGRVQYSDVPPPPSAKGVEKKNLKGSVVETSVLPFQLMQLAKDARSRCIPRRPARKAAAWRATR
ncbi:MAG: DUF4124 domain-containing protein [Betaproteobacteria bacterium]|nr:DUF4124 domain-containing protein [Betaproteobacteria bacterium]